MTIRTEVVTLYYVNGSMRSYDTLEEAEKEEQIQALEEELRTETDWYDPCAYDIAMHILDRYTLTRKP